MHRIGDARPWPSVMLATLIALLTFGQVLAESTIQLPDIGDPTATAISPAEERALRELLLGQIYAQLPVVHDPELNAYLQSLGTRLTGGGVGAEQAFTFVLIDDPTINAFAAPGGIIAVFTGLILNAENEAELAGVLAHEISHVTQRHIARAFANARGINLTTVLGILGAIIAGAYNPQVGSAALYSTLAANAQTQLAFSRGHEQEADRVGLTLLAEANIDPLGMPAFFERLHKQTQLNGQLPEFLSSHPVTLSRISDTRNRAAQYKGPFAPDSHDFHFAKARTRVLTSPAGAVIANFEQQRAGRHQTDPFAQYTYALALTYAGRPAQAIQVLDALEDHQASLPVALARAEAALAADKPKQAVAQLEELNALYPDQAPVVFALAQALIAQDQPERALKLAEHFDYANPEFYRLKAQAAAQAGKTDLSHEALSDYYLAYGRLDTALEQLEIALKQADSTISKARIRVKQKALDEKKEELR